MATPVSAHELRDLEACLLNAAGDVPLHNRFRALFTLKALKSDEAVDIISRGDSYCIPPHSSRLMHSRL